jgi:PAS domain S-box-containing protein
MSFKWLANAGRIPVRLLFFAVVYYALGRLGYHLAYLNHGVSPIWPSTGVGLAVLLLWGCRWWPGIFIGSLGFSLDIGVLPAAAVGVALGNVVGTLVAAGLVARFARGRQVFEQSQTIVRFVLLVIAATTINATIGMVSVCAGGLVSRSDFFSSWITWWMADVASAILLTPLVMIWVVQPRPPRKLLRVGEGLGLILTLGMLGVAMVSGNSLFPFLAQSEWVFILPLIWAAFRFGRHGAITAALLIFIMAAWGVYLGRGPFVTLHQGESILLLQLFTGALSATALILVAAVTEFTRADGALQAASQMNQQIIAGARDGIIVQGRDLKYLVWNPFMEQLAGVTAGEIIGKHPLEVLPRLQAEAVMARLEQTLAGKGCEPLELHFEASKTGRSSWITITFSPLHDAQGQITGIISIVHDLTESRAMTEALRSSEERYRGLAEALPDAIYILDAQSVYQYVNETAARWLGLPAAEFIGRKRTDFFPAETIRQQQILMDQVRETGQPAIIEWNVPFPSGERWVETRLVPLSTAPGKRELVIAISRDLTDQRRLQQQILEISAEERQRIGYDLHDGLGQHLSGVAFITKALEKELMAISPAHADDARKVVGLLNQAIAQTRSLARMLAPVDVEASGLPAALANLADETGKLFRVDAFFHSGLSELRFDGQTGMALYRIAQEAIHNAIRHGAANRIEINLEPDQDEVCLTVRDNGRGYANASKPQSGMGMRIMQYRASSVGGRILFQSVVGKGTEVICRVPIK